MKQSEGGVNTVVRGPKLLDAGVVLPLVVVVIMVRINQEGAFRSDSQLPKCDGRNFEEKMHENLRMLD